MQEYLSRVFDPKNPDHVADLDELAFWSSPFGHTLFDTILVRKGIRALDIGCGNGFPLIELAGRLGHTATVVGVDPWETAVERVRHKARVRGLKNVQAHVMRAETMPFEDQSFNLIVSNNGINNVEDPQRVISECFRLCRKGGQLVFTFNLPATMYEFYYVFETILKERHMDAEIMKMKQHIHTKRKPLEEVIDMVVFAGFRVQAVIQKSFAYRFADARAMFAHFTIREFFLPPWKALLPDEVVGEVFGALEKRLDAISLPAGELRITIPYTCFDCRKD